MRMDFKKTSKQLTKETIEYAGDMDPESRNDFIDLIHDQYQIARHSQTSREKCVATVYYPNPYLFPHRGYADVRSFRKIS